MRIIPVLLCVCFMALDCTGQNDVFRNIKIGTRWTYEMIEHVGWGIYGWTMYEITETTYLNGRFVYVIENDDFFEKDFLWLDSTRMYFWEPGLGTFQLHFDFDSVTSYTTPWTGHCHSAEGVAEVTIDSVKYIGAGQDSLQIQYLSIENSGSIEGTMFREVFYGTGPTYSGLKLGLGDGLCDYDFSIGKLRCFEADSVFYQFVDYACDTTFVGTATENDYTNRISIYPNPSNGLITIAGIEDGAPFEIYDLAGRKMEAGLSKGMQIESECKGFVFIRFLQRGSWIVQKMFLF